MDKTSILGRLRRRNLISTLSAFVPLWFGGCFALCAQELRIPDKDIFAAPLFQPDTVTICFMGDVMMHSAQLAHAQCGDGTFDFSTYFQHIATMIQDADIAVANMEFTMAGEPYSGYPAFSAPDSYASYLAECGLDIFLCANNHIFDKGSKGAQRTLDIYRNMESTHRTFYTGLADSPEDLLRTTPLRILRKGMRFAFINMTYGTNLGYDAHWPQTNYIGMKESLEEAFRRAEEDCDVTIALPHWGNEYELLHSESQEASARWMAGCGADAIIGCHPHVVQDTASVAGIPVAYSLGNAVSNMSAADTQLELMLTMRIAREEDGDIRILPFELTYLWCSRPGGFCRSYTVLPVERFIGSRNMWCGPWEYDKMTATYERVKKTHNNR